MNSDDEFLLATKRGRSFVRHKVSREFRAEAAHLIMEGVSLSTIGHKFGVSKEAVRQWRIKFEEAFAQKPLSKVKERAIILLDETKVKRDGKEHMVCPSVALDLSRREIISAQAFRSRSSFSTIAVMEKALKPCGSRPIVLVDHAPWYNWAFERDISMEKFHGYRLLMGYETT
jgi:transposase-like protein